jgi:hypothetical protein
MASVFDPSAFLDATLTEPTKKRPPLPVGDYTAMIGEIKARTWTSKKDLSKSGVALDVPLVIDVPAEVQSSLGLTQPTITLTDSIMLDVTEGGTIDNAPGRNRRLRLYREAADMNKPGDSFSFRAMQGKAIRVKLSHDLWEGEPVEKIDGVARL